MNVEIIVRDGVELRVDTCVTCRKPFEQERRQGRPRQKCDTCSGRAAAITVRSEHVVPSDPPVPRGGLCVCGCGKKRPTAKQAGTYAGAQIDADPFATADCCRRWYRVPFAPSEEEQDASERMARGGRQAASARLVRTGWRETV